MKDKTKKLILIAALSFLVTLLAMPGVAHAAGSQQLTRTFVALTNAAVAGEGDGDGFETTPAYAYVDDNTNYAVDTDSGANVNNVATDPGTDKHNYGGFGMDTIPSTSGTINGITVRADIAVDSTLDAPFTAIRLSWDNGGTWTTEQQLDVTSVPEATYTYGGVADTWGRTWSGSELTDANFLVQVINGDTKAANSKRDFSLDYIQVTITFTPAWDSYRDTGRTTVWGDNAGTQYDDTYHIVYMKGTSFLDGTYNVGYYDGGGTKRATDNNIALVDVVDSRGTLGNTSDSYEPMYDLLNPPAAAGTWNAVVQPYGATNAFPTDYSTVSADPDYYELLADDTFIIDASAIPEFSTVMAAIGVAGLCFGIYWWMRKKYRRKMARAYVAN